MLGQRLWIRALFDGVGESASRLASAVSAFTVKLAWERWSQHCATMAEYGGIHPGTLSEIVKNVAKQETGEAKPNTGASGSEPNGFLHAGAASQRDTSNAGSAAWRTSSAHWRRSVRK